MMALIDPPESIVVQTHEPPMTGLDSVTDHAAAVRALVPWDRVGVLMDEGPQAVVTVLLKDEEVVSASRSCLGAAESVDALRAYKKGSADPKKPTELRCWQGHAMTRAQTRSLSELTVVWRESFGQRKEQTEAEWRAFFEDLERGTRSRGRAATIGVSTRNQVLLDAHGRCMFEGCGVDLTEDPVTGVRGNFATLAHNVAASEGGARGALYLSGRLADDPENIMLLCDKHHRLVDSIAKADYTAAALSAMRRRFCEEGTKLLDALALVPTPRVLGGVACASTSNRIAYIAGCRESAEAHWCAVGRPAPDGQRQRSRVAIVGGRSSLAGDEYGSRADCG